MKRTVEDWSREILSDLGRVLEKLSDYLEGKTELPDLGEIKDTLFEVYGNIETPYVDDWPGTDEDD